MSQAFAKGLTFEEFSRLTGIECRAVEFDVPTADLNCRRQIIGFEHFNPQTETLTMLKPIYGPKGVPRAWRKKLHQVLESWQQCEQLYAEPELCRSCAELRGSSSCAAQNKSFIQTHLTHTHTSFCIHSFFMATLGIRKCNL